VALDFQNISEHLRGVLLNLKHMSPMQRFNEVSKPRFELQWQTVAFRYGVEKLEWQAWMIPDWEVLNATGKSSPLMNTDCTDQEQTQVAPRRHGDTEEIGGSGDRVIGGLCSRVPKLAHARRRWCPAPQN
jgi:hypothetical protein